MLVMHTTNDFQPARMYGVTAISQATNIPGRRVVAKGLTLEEAAHHWRGMGLSVEPQIVAFVTNVKNAPMNVELTLWEDGIWIRELTWEETAAGGSMLLRAMYKKRQG
mgnify:FL=1